MTGSNQEPSYYQSIGAAGLIFAVVAFLIALFLVSQTGTQVTWNSSKSFSNQPGFWPVMALCGMALFGMFELRNQWRKNRRIPLAKAAPELMHWLAAVEYAVWFLVYVWLVPYLGYLGSTLLFCGLLTWRVGYRSRSILSAALLVGVAIVIVFKSFLSVKIPGGIIYDWLPSAVRNFFILYL